MSTMYNNNTTNNNNDDDGDDDDNTKGAFQKSELAGWTMTAPVILKIK